MLRKIVRMRGWTRSPWLTGRTFSTLLTRSEKASFNATLKAFWKNEFPMMTPTINFKRGYLTVNDSVWKTKFYQKRNEVTSQFEGGVNKMYSGNVNYSGLASKPEWSAAEENSTRSNDKSTSDHGTDKSKQQDEELARSNKGGEGGEEAIKMRNNKELNEQGLRDELAAKEREIIELKDKYLRSVAEVHNVQNRCARDIQSARDFALQSFGRDLLDSIDNLERAIGLFSKDSGLYGNEAEPTAVVSDAVAESDDPSQVDKLRDLLKSLESGLRMTQRVLDQTLKRHGIIVEDPGNEAGTPFNPNLHEAAFHVQREDLPDGSVFTTIQKGFVLNGRVLRAAKVGVVKNS